MKRLSQKQKARNRSKYAYIRRIYERTNKEITYKQFKNRVLLREKAFNMSYKEAAKKEANTETFVTPAERSRANLVNALRERHREAYDELRMLSRDKGKFSPVKNNLVWDTERHKYKLVVGGNEYLIDVTNSPEEVYIERI